MIYCEFEPTGKVFKSKNIYKCNNCGMTVALENPDAKILCFPYAKNEFEQHANAIQSEFSKEVLAKNNNEIDEYLQKQARLIEELNSSSDNASDQEAIMDKEPNENLCSEEDISHRLSICNACEHYQDNVCLLCGCAIVREKNYKNKLAQKSANCPDGRWGPVND